MICVPAFKYESNLEPGIGLVKGVASGAVKLPGASGAGVFCGVYDYLNNPSKDKPNTTDTVGVTVFGLVKVLAGGDVTAFSFGVLSDNQGRMRDYDRDVDIDIERVAGVFLESGAAGQYVDFFVNPVPVKVVSNVPSANKKILSFNIISPVAAVGVINETAKTIAITVPNGTTVTALVPIIEHNGVAVSPTNGAAGDFSSPVEYTVTAEDETTVVYTVTVTVLEA